MKRAAYWLAASLIGVATAALMAHSAKAYTGDDFVRPVTKIKGCIAIVNKVRDGTMTPTEWLEANKESFLDLSIELKDRNYPPAKEKEMMMGLAISICMDRKGLTNTCVSARDPEKRDVQIMRTAHVAECWAQQFGDEGRPQPPPHQPEPPVATGPTLPPMSPADVAQYNEDASIIFQPVRFIGDDEGGAKEARFASCASYWQSLSYNRSPEARQVLYAVRVARCMYRTGFAVLPARCPPIAFNSMLTPGCYARF